MVNENNFKVVRQLTLDLADFVKHIKENGPTQSASLCAEHYRMLREMHDEIDAVKKEAYHAMEHYTMSVLPELFEDECVTTLNLASGYRVTVKHIMRASVKADSKGHAFQWLIDNDLGDLVTETVNAASLSATARMLNEEGRELPTDFFNVATLPQVSLTKTK